MKRKGRKLAISITLAEVILIPSLFALEVLSGYRAGIMHHLYYKRCSYLAAFYRQDFLIFHLMGIVASILGVLFVCRNRWHFIGKASLIRYGVFLLAVVLCYLLPWFGQLNIYAHLLIVLECCLVLETLLIFGCCRD